MLARVSRDLVNSVRYSEVMGFYSWKTFPPKFSAALAAKPYVISQNILETQEWYRRALSSFRQCRRPTLTARTVSRPLDTVPRRVTLTVDLL